ncbi:MAG: DMT family transporter [Alphaproteobacteria bacterium]|jgi:drug/metabolite transporter (DMT)-like permease|nr:DMT family transporter [Alphaproteobacteria bacterium]
MTSGQIKSMNPFQWGLLVILSIFWGGSFLFVGIAVEDFQPFTIAFLRVLIASFVLWLTIIITSIKIPKKASVWYSFFIMGTINSAIPFSLIAWGQSHITSGLASILIATTPLITVIGAHFYTADEKITINRFIGILMGFLGVIILLGPDLLGYIGKNLLGQLAIVLAAILYALASIYGRRYSRQKIPPLVIATGQVTASAIILFPAIILIDQPWSYSPPSNISWAAIISLGVFSTAIAYLIYFRILATAGATNLMLVNFLVPITAIFLGIMVLGESISLQNILGMFFIGVGLTLIDGRLNKKIKILLT